MVEGDVDLPQLTLLELFNKFFPQYLEMGMSYEEYWEKDCRLVEFYREADKLRRDRANQEAWLQGMYVYDAILRIAPVLRAFSQKGAKPEPYVSEPYAISEEQVELKKKRDEKAKYDQGLMKMRALAEAGKQQTKEKGE